jgi:ABC-type lipoprotein export system ATPase subunit
MHTLADKEFSYSGDPDYYLSSYVAAMKSADIRVGIITNHNKFDRDEFKALAKTAKNEEILLLPGLELSVRDGSHGMHTLIVFSEQWISNQENENYIQSFLNVTFAGQSNFENENGRSNHDLTETIRELDKFDKDYFLICAHVEAKNGLWGGLSGGRISELGKSDLFRERCMGFQKVSTYDKREQVREWLGSWYPAEVEGCDCKSITEIGHGKPVYIKLGAFTFEALRFVLLDCRNRVATQLTKIEHSYVANIFFEGDKLDGRSIPLSPGLNTVIGIRGSGKSTILESIRYTLEIPFGQNAADKEYKEDSVQHALGSGGKITLTARDRMGIEYEVRRIIGELPDVYVDGSLHPGINIRETILHKPIYFGQKDLSNTGQGFENDLVEKLVGDKLIDVREKIAAQRIVVVELTRRLQKLSDVGDKQKEYEGKKQDAEYQLKLFRKHRVEEKLQKQVDFERDERALSSIADSARSYVTELEEFISRNSDDFTRRNRHESKQNTTLFTEVFAIFDRISGGFTEITKIATNARAESAQIAEKVKEFEILKSALKEEFAQVARTLSDELKSSGLAAIKPDEFLRLRKVVETATQILSALAKEKEQQVTLQAQLNAALSVLNDYWHQEFRIIKQELDKINEQETALQIEVTYKGDKPAFLRFVKDLVRGSRLRDATLLELVNAFADGAGLYRDFGKAREMLGGSADIFTEYFEQNLAALLTWQVPNSYAIKYHGKQLKHHSLGQRASALILFVLSQRDNDLVIIDQPEDDLDNQTIYEDVIKLVKRLKAKTQFIFATHNPNIPVLGDADQVIACAYTDDTILVKTGSIDSPELQEAIVSIMEGGSEAFERRKEIYQVWKR